MTQDQKCQEVSIPLCGLDPGGNGPKLQAQARWLSGILEEVGTFGQRQWEPAHDLAPEPAGDGGHE